MSEPARQPSTVHELARAYGSKVFHTARAIVGDPAEAEDIQQDVFLRLLNKLPDGVTSWPGFLVTMTTRLAIDRLRSRNRRQRLLSIFGGRETGPSVESEELSEERSRAFRRAIGRLPARESQAFCLRYLSDMTTSGIADLLGVTENHVGVILHRARARLRRDLSAQGVIDNEASA